MSKCQFYWGDTLIPQGRGNVVRLVHEMLLELGVRGGGGGSGGGGVGGGIGGGGGGGEVSKTDCLCV